jgi:ppGpp synthetase/RelA/SpoT-type nucleotidyltranferase
MTKSEVDRLGERLRKGELADLDLRQLDLYRRSFADAYLAVVGLVRQRSGQQPTGRPAKSTTSIVEKLKRESIRLSQMQDIAGCRLVVFDIAEQGRVVDDLTRAFDKVTIVDRRERPSHGYRAVHVIAFVERKPIEIQVRTTLQHLWAEFSEKLSDLVDPAIKYGGGANKLRSALAETSKAIANEESLELSIASRETDISALHEKAAQIREQARSALTRLTGVSLTSDQLVAKRMLEQSEKNLAALEQQIADTRETVRLQKQRLIALKEQTTRLLREAITSLPERKGDT